MIAINGGKVYGFLEAIDGMRYPMNSWDKSDSYYSYTNGKCVLGDNDIDLAKRLAAAGTDHRKYLRFINVYASINAPLYWWKEFDTYRMGVEKNSCSTMHKITSKPFTIDDFSHDKMLGPAVDVLQTTVETLNAYREMYVSGMQRDKSVWYTIIQLLPSSYNQKRKVMISYEALANMYHARKNHKLSEWREFCEWVESLPYSDLITGGGEKK